MRYLLLATSVVFVFTPWAAFAQEDTETTEGAEAEAQTEETEEQRQVRRLGDVVGSGDEFDIDFDNLNVPEQPVEDVPEVSLPDPEQDEQLQTLLRRRAFEPNDQDTLDALSDLIDEIEADIEEALAGEDLALAQQLAGVVAEVEPDREIIAEVEAAVEQESMIGQTLEQATAALEAGRLTQPAGDNAAELFARVLELDPGNETAQTGLEETHQAIVDSAISMARDDLDFEGAEARLVEAEGVLESPEAIAEARDSIVEFRTGYTEDLHQEALTHIDEGRYDEADESITELVALGHDRDRVESLQASLADARLYGSFEPGQVFDDQIEALGEPGPEMVVIPAGSFMMGSPEDEEDRMSNEGPQHRVTFDRGFALSRTEITVGQFAEFVEATGYRTDAEVSGSSRIYNLETGRMDARDDVNWQLDYAGETADEDLPVIHVSWRDVSAYIDWLSEETGRNYRLPSEAEFEYALRAGSQTPYWWGEGPPPEDDMENVTGDGDTSPTGARWNVAFRRYSDGHWGPAPVGSLVRNPFELNDMGGNVMEWVEDCWHDSFVRAPADGSAWVNPGCNRRVIKGGSWSSTPAMARSAFRISSTTESTDMRVGFRVARDL
ncbi:MULTISPECIES: formylglycine-generating enzyme family protein [unclassified Wenzhouxiangella]|uniref:formylglycine-generating enzyme family protein n=1 Tax=unclassified Wenzhouxiangella TaxID=2613841 RepID=UPI0015F26279|nr:MULTISPECIES: formylglycine-generating enzyme family protein [unclassified Wenzhouxiangella]